MSDFNPEAEYLIDCAMLGEPVPAEAEKAYRRGFSQGAALAYYAIRDGATLAAVEGWIEDVMDWRHEGNGWRTGQEVPARRPPREPWP
jgi:hypothetical protein